METDGRYMMENNYALLQGAARLVPGRGGAASSTPPRRRSTARGKEFGEERAQNEEPLNVYAYSKFLFDQYVRQDAERTHGSQVAGLRYFNVYGPNEAHKGPHGARSPSMPSTSSAPKGG